jgi:3'-5' exoribonuclease
MNSAAESPLLHDLKEGDTFNGCLLALEASFKTSAKGSEYLELKLGDASGDLKAFLWDLRAIEGDLDQVAADAFLKVKGQVSAYNGRLQMRLDKLRPARDEEVGDLSRFFATSSRPLAEMTGELDEAIAGTRDPWIKRLLELLLVEDAGLRAAFCKAPAAKSMHHSFLGGLLEHTLSVLGMAGTWSWPGCSCTTLARPPNSPMSAVSAIPTRATWSATSPCRLNGSAGRSRRSRISPAT